MKKEKQKISGKRSSRLSYLMGSEAFYRSVVFPTLFTSERFLLCVTELVFLQVTELVELFATAGTSVAPLSNPWPPCKTHPWSTCCCCSLSIRVCYLNGHHFFWDRLVALGGDLPLSRGLFSGVGADGVLLHPGQRVNPSWFSSQTRAAADRRGSREANLFVCRKRVWLFVHSSQDAFCTVWVSTCWHIFVCSASVLLWVTVWT